LCAWWIILLSRKILVAESRQFDTTCLKTTKIILGQFVDGPES
jgi:hypothetical protein